ncbi:MAG TPA: M15 family metallopeptidase [Acidimicrobiia bacterium]
MRRLLPTVALVLALAGVAAGCIPASQPAQNGRLPDSALTTVTPSCRIANDVADPLRAMGFVSGLAGAAVFPEESSFTAPLPGPPRIESCYRSYEMQEWWRNFYCFFSSCDFAAVPGTSVHGWGRAVDFQDGDGKLTFNSIGYLWLEANAWRWGFVHPDWAQPWGSSPEPWHWEHS